MSWVDKAAAEIHSRKGATIQEIKKTIQRAISEDMRTGKKSSAGKDMLVSSGVSSQTKEPFVMIESDDLDHPLQIDPASARNLGTLLMHASESAMSDAFVVNFFQKKIGVDEQAAAGVLVAIRAWRNEHDARQ